LFPHESQDFLLSHMPDIYLIALSFFIIAMVYSSVGFGGGSSYLAIMTLFSVPFLLMRSTSLLCNILVVAGGTYVYYQRKQISWKRVLPFALTSVPMAFIGGLWPLKENMFFILLGFTLFATSITMWGFKAGNPEGIIIQPSISAKENIFQLLIGALTGLLSGLVGIGGGIFLSPVLHFTRWGTAREIAAASSFFILINSISGLAGQMAQGKFTFDLSFALPLLAAVLIGGQIGSRLGSSILSQTVIKRLTAVLILLVSLNLLEKYLI
jgi:uncharacterized membrane protein YfcA